MLKKFWFIIALGILLASFQNFTLVKPPQSLTFYPQFTNALNCFERLIDFDDGTATYIKTAVPAECWGQPFRFTVTHENRQNNKIGDLNHDHVQEMLGFMSDYTADHFGTLERPLLFLSEFKKDADGITTLHLGTDTRSGQINSVTGRPYGNGFLFMGVSDGSIWARPELALDQEFQVEFSYRVVDAAIEKFPDASQLNAHRFTLGFNVDWKESAPRTNRTHFLEFDLYLSPGYFDVRKKEMSHPSQCPQNDGADYDFCYTDQNAEGKYVDGKYLSLAQFADQPKGDPKLNEWRKLSLPLSAFIRSYGWRNPPVEGWSQARLSGMYFGIESQGAQKLRVEIKDYQFKQGLTPIPFLRVPAGLFRVSNSLFAKQEASYCALISLGHLQAYGYDSTSAKVAFEKAPRLTAQVIDAAYASACTLPSKNAIYRAGKLGLFSNGKYICHFESAEHLRRWGFTDAQYANAPDLGPEAYLNFNYLGSCPL